MLRKVSQNKENLPEIPQRDEVKYLSIRYSHPKWLVKRLLLLLGRTETEALLALDNGTPPLTVQINPLKTTAEELTRELSAWGVTAKPHAWVPGCLGTDRRRQPHNAGALPGGKAAGAGPGGRLVSLIAGVQPGQRVLDVCAAPGGKSFSAAFAMGDKGRIISCDVHGSKLKRIEEGAARLGLTSIETAASDGRVFRPEWADAYDTVLVDAPCSGLGIIRKKPDVRYKRADDLFTLPVVQTALLDNAARYVAPGRCAGLLHLYDSAGGKPGRCGCLSIRAPGF